MTVEEIVDAYIRDYRDGARAEMRFFEIQRSSLEAIRKAALCVLPSGKRHPHQHRIPRTLLKEVESRLQRIRPRLAQAIDFDAINRLVHAEIGNLAGIGALTIYDISHRIGAHLKKLPDRVYLHAGTKIGARAFGIKGESFDPSILPKPYSRLTPAEIEDCLCIYKDELKASSKSDESALGQCCCGAATMLSIVILKPSLTVGFCA